MAHSHGTSVLRTIVANALMTFGAAIAAGLAGGIVVHFIAIDEAYGGSTMANALAILPLYMFTVIVTVMINGFGIALSIIVLPVILCKWPNVRFYNLMLAACFAVGMLAWPLTDQLVGLNGWNADGLKTISGLSALMAGLCGLYYPRTRRLAETL